MIQTNDNLRFMRLNTGEDIITELSFIEDKENKNTYYVLSNPLKIVYSLSENSDQIGISLLPWVFDRLCATSQFVIFPTDVLTMTIPSDELKKYYVLFNSKLNEYDYEQEYEGYDLKSEDISKEDMQNINQAINEIKNNKKRLH